MSISRFLPQKSRFLGASHVFTGFLALAAIPTAHADLTVTNFRISRYSVSFDISGTVPAGVPGPGENGRGTLRLSRSTVNCNWFDSVTGRPNDIVGPARTPIDWIVDNTGSDGQWALTNTGVCTNGSFNCFRIDVGCHPTYPNYSDYVNFFFGETPAALQPGTPVSGHCEVDFGPNVEMINLDTLKFSLSIGCVVIATDLQNPPATPTLSLTASDSTLQTGQQFTVDVAMNATSASLTGLQLAMNYDHTKLRLDSVAPATNSPFAAEIAEQINNTNGTLRYAAGVDENQNATSAAANLVTLSFTALTNETCGAAGLLSFGTVSGTTTRCALADATTLAPNLGTLASIKIDGTAPVLNNVLANVSVATDAGSTFGAYVANPGVTVSDNCDTLTPTLLITYPDNSTASLWPSDGMFPIGTTTLAWSVTDASGNAASASRTIVVANYQLVDATMSFDGPFVSASTRSIRFKAGSNTQVLSLSASGSPFSGGSINAIQVPVAASYPCLSAKDPAHSITDTAAATISGVRYQAAFSLQQGDSNDDDVVDIVDFGSFVAARGAGKALDATSNFNSDTIIGTADFSYIGINFFDVGEACGAYNGATPRERIKVTELRRSGRGELAIADINGDGWVDTTDITLFLQGVEPRQPARPARAAAPDTVDW